MYGIVKIGDQEVPMLSMAAVDIYYKQIFHEDPILAQNRYASRVNELIRDFRAAHPKATPEEVSELELDPETSADRVDFFSKMGFVMAHFADDTRRKTMLQLNMGKYIEWLSQFERTAFYNAMGDIQAIYEDQKPASSIEKKTDAE